MPRDGGERKKRPVLEVFRKASRYFCSKKYVLRRLPVVDFMKNYRARYLINDTTAGLTVALTAIPQGIAYAVVAGLEPQYGLYSGFMGCFVYFLFGTVKEMNIGPTAIMALMTQDCVENYNSDVAVLLCFLTGCIILLFGILHLGFLVNFISIPVTLGFTTAAAITISSSQVKSLLGIKAKSNTFLDSWISIIQNISATKYPDLSLGLSTIAFLIGMKLVSDAVSRRVKSRQVVSRGAMFCAKTIKFISLGKNAIAVISGALAAYIVEQYGFSPFRLTGEIQGGLPEAHLPPFSTNITENNVTRVIPFEEMVSTMDTRIISVPLISILETIAIAKSFAKGRTLDATQEMIALGMVNITGAFFRSMPNAGSFTRSALNSASGVKTPLGGLVTGALVLLALTLTSTFKYIPKATLAAVIITAMIFMVEYHEIWLIWRTKKLDMIPLLLTVVGCLFLGLDYGILIGIVVNIFLILIKTTRPKIKEEQTDHDEELLLIRPEETLFFPGGDYLRDHVLKASHRKIRNLVVIDGRNIHSIDSTIAKNIRTLVQDFEKSEQAFVFWNWQRVPMKTCIRLDPKLEKHFQNSDTLEELLGSSKPSESLRKLSESEEILRKPSQSQESQRKLSESEESPTKPSEDV